MHLLLSILLVFPDVNPHQGQDRKVVLEEKSELNRKSDYNTFISLHYGPQVIKPVVGNTQLTGKLHAGMFMGLMWRNRNHFFHPYFMADVATMDSSDEYPVTYRDGANEVPTTSHLLTNFSTMRLGISADLPLKGSWIPRVFFEVGLSSVFSLIRIPKPNPIPDESAYFINRETIHKDQSLGIGSGIALRREFAQREKSSPVFYMELSTSIWQTGSIEYLYTDEHFAEAVRQFGEDAFARILADEPHFVHEYYEGYRYKTPLNHLVFRFAVGLDF